MRKRKYGDLLNDGPCRGILLEFILVGAKMSKENVLFKINGIPVTRCTCLRIPPEERIEGRYYYNIRHDDEDGWEPYSLERMVMVNHFGTIETLEPIPELDPDKKEGQGMIVLT